jgi:hypothetical protein
MMSGDMSGSGADNSGGLPEIYDDRFDYSSTPEGSCSWIDNYTSTISYSYGGSGSAMINGTIFDNSSSTGGRELTCQQCLELGSPLPLSMTAAETMRYIQIIYYSINFPVALFLNILVVYLVARYKVLHNITFYLALQITIVDLANSITLYPTTLANLIADRYVFTGLCDTLGVIFTFLRTARNLLMMVLVADRFCLIFLPFWYSRHRVKMTIPLSIVAGMIPFILAIVPANGILGCYGFQRLTWSCVIGPGCTNAVGCTTHRAFVTTSTNGALFVAFLLYLALLVKARKLRNKVAIFTSNENPEDREIERRRIQREQRANTTILILFTTLVGISYPSYLFFTFGNITLNSLNIQPPPAGYTIAAIISRSIFALITVMDPIVIMRNQDVKQVLLEIFAKMKKKWGMLISHRSSSEENSSTTETQNSVNPQDPQ